MESFKFNKNTRLDQAPILHVKGSHAAVGFTIGRQFRSLIEDVLEQSELFNKEMLPSYKTSEGKGIYDSSYEICSKTYPQYMEELMGMADGAKVPFYKLFLLNLEFSIKPGDKKEESRCSSLMCNSEAVIMAHNEDTGPELLNNTFIVSAEILGDEGKTLEKFTSFTYAGCLPGFTSGFNQHGFIHCINTLNPVDTCHGKTPRNFLARALFAASTLDEALNILKDKGNGVSDGFSVNMHFAKQEGPQMMYNVEVSPNPWEDESKISLFEIKYGETYAHCNKYLHLDVGELARATLRSNRRHEAIAKHPRPDSVEMVKQVLSDRSDPDLPVFRYGGKEPDWGNTVAVGIFDITNRRWSLYIEPPIRAKPIVVIPLDF